MDYSKFLDDGFDPKEWINVAFKANKDSANDQYATTLVMKLQLLVQEINNVIEETSQEVISNLPRVMRDVEIIKQEASMLQDQMRNIKHDIQKVEKDTSQSMETLLKLDTLKSRMEQTSEALQQADNWTVLSNEVKDVLLSGDSELLASKLVAMQQSLRLLAKVPDYEDRCQHLEALKNRLETMVSPLIVSAIASGSQDKTKHFAKMFEDIQRLPQIYKYYEHYHKSQLSKVWTEYSDKDSSLTSSLSRFYDSVISTVHSQLSWCSSVFNEPAVVVIQMITAAISQCEANFASSIKLLLDTSDNDILSNVSELKLITDRFCGLLEKTLSERNSLKSGSCDSLLWDLTCAIYKPYSPYFNEYKKLESHFLNQHLNAIEMEDRQSFDTTITRLSESVSKVFKMASLVNDRCVKLTGGLGYLCINDIYKDYFTEYATQVKRIISNIAERFKSPVEGQAELDSWGMFSLSLQLVEISGDMILHIEDLDQTVISNVLLAAEQLQSEIVSPLTDVKVIFGVSSEQLMFLDQLRDSVVEKQSLLIPSLKVIRSLSESAHKLAFDSVFSQIARHLHCLSANQVWMAKSAGGALTTDLPTFSLSPQEYITQIGQYMLTLPQYLDPFANEVAESDNSETLSKLTLKAAIKYGRLPYTKLQDRADVQMDTLWLESISRAAMYSYCEEILRIHEISEHATKQLVTDMEYLINVLDDLDLPPIEQLISIRDLMKVKPSEFAKASANVQKSVASTIQAMRNISV